MNCLNYLIKELIDNIESVEKGECIDILNQLSECKGFDINTRINRHGETFLMKAVDYNCLDVVKHIIEVLYADPNTHDNAKWTALHRSSYRGHSEIIDYLISVPGIDVNKKTCIGFTALHIAADYGFKYSVEALLRSNELDISLRDKWGRTAEELARGEEHHEIADMIAAYEPNVSAFYNK